MSLGLSFEPEWFTWFRLNFLGMESGFEIRAPRGVVRGPCSKVPGPEIDAVCLTVGARVLKERGFGGVGHLDRTTPLSKAIHHLVTSAEICGQDADSCLEICTSREAFC